MAGIAARASATASRMYSPTSMPTARRRSGCRGRPITIGTPTSRTTRRRPVDDALCGRSAAQRRRHRIREHDPGLRLTVGRDEAADRRVAGRLPPGLRSRARPAPSTRWSAPIPKPAANRSISATMRRTSSACPKRKARRCLPSYWRTRRSRASSIPTAGASATW